jgi:hypothetical protein
VRFTHDNVILAIIRELLPNAKVYVIAFFEFFAVRACGHDNSGFHVLAGWQLKKGVFLNIAFNDEAVLHCAEADCHISVRVSLGKYPAANGSSTSANSNLVPGCARTSGAKSKISAVILDVGLRPVIMR